MEGKLIEEEGETRPEHVSASCLDENVCLRNIQNYFTHGGWKALLHVVEETQCGFVLDVQMLSVMMRKIQLYVDCVLSGFKKASKTSKCFWHQCHSF